MYIRAAEGEEDDDLEYEDSDSEPEHRVPRTEARGVLGHEANYRGDEHPRQGGHHVGYSHQGASEVWREVSVVGEYSYVNGNH